MAVNFKSYTRLEPRQRERDFEAGFAAAVHDPAWFLARQWQMGEYQGENASSPVLGSYVLQSDPMRSASPDVDPTIIPAEAIVESEPDSWWTMGRRIRAGKRLAQQPAVQAQKDLLFTDPPPPYEQFSGELDGQAIWDARQAGHSRRRVCG